MNKAISVDQLMRMKFNEMKFEGQWKDSIGVPECSGVWLIWGGSGNGKTSFTMQLAKYLCNFDKVVYNTLEEGARKSMQLAVQRSGMMAVRAKFNILNREPLEDLKVRLNKRKSAKIVIIDSLQYTGITRKEYKDLKEEFPNVLFIFISHADGKKPEGRLAKFVQFDADVKIRIEGYMAFITSRYGGGKPYTIWAEGAEEYYGTQN